MWWLLVSTLLVYNGAQFMGPYPDKAVCEAARSGATEFGQLTSPCLLAEHVDEYMLYQMVIDEKIAEGGYGH